MASCGLPGSDRSDDRSITDGSRADDSSITSINSYEDVCNPDADLVELSINLCDDEKRGVAAAGYRRQLERIGDTAYRQLLATFWSELKAGEEPRNRGAALMARLKKVTETDAAEAEEARRVIAALGDQGAEVSRADQASVSLSKQRVSLSGEFQMPVILVDTCEQTPLTFANCPSETATLATGDYSIMGFEDEFTVERKSLDDLVGSCTNDRERFERELVRMRGYYFRRLLIVGTVEDVEAHRYRSRAEPKEILASVTAFEIRYGMPVAFCQTPAAAALQIERWAYYFFREKLKTATELVERYVR